MSNPLLIIEASAETVTVKKVSVKFVAWTARWDLNYITLTTYVISLCACILDIRAASMGFSSMLLAGTFLAVVWRDLEVVSSPSVSNTSNGLFISYTRRICSRLLAKLISTDIYLPPTKMRTHQQSQRALIRLIKRDMLLCVHFLTYVSNNCAGFDMFWLKRAFFSSLICVISSDRSWPRDLGWLWSDCSLLL